MTATTHTADTSAIDEAREIVYDEDGEIVTEETLVSRLEDRGITVERPTDDWWSFQNMEHTTVPAEACLHAVQRQEDPETFMSDSVVFFDAE